LWECGQLRRSCPRDCGQVADLSTRRWESCDFSPSGDPVISTRQRDKRLDKKIGFPYSIIRKKKQQQKGRRNPMPEIIIDRKLKVNISEQGIKVNNLLYQLRKFMVELYLGILKAIFSALEEQAIETLKRASVQRYVKNGRRSRGSDRSLVVMYAIGQI